MMKTSLYRVAVILIAGLSSCAPKDDTKKAEREVDRFHQHWNNWEFTAVYNEAHKDFRAAQAANKTIAQFKHSREVYGAFKSAKQRGLEVTSEHAEKNLILKYDCVYEHGAAVEAFEYRMTGGTPLLASYYILAPDSAVRFEAEEARRKAQEQAKKR